MPTTCPSVQLRSSDFNGQKWSTSQSTSDRTHQTATGHTAVGSGHVRARNARPKTWRMREWPDVMPCSVWSNPVSLPNEVLMTRRGRSVMTWRASVRSSSLCHTLSSTDWPDAPGMSPVTPAPESDHNCLLLFLFLSPRPLHPCFELTNHKV
jgi:hypothetical protein